MLSMGCTPNSSQHTIEQTSRLCVRQWAATTIITTKPELETMLHWGPPDDTCSSRGPPLENVITEDISCQGPHNSICPPIISHALLTAQENRVSAETHLRRLITITALIKLRNSSVQLHLLLLSHTIELRVNTPPMFAPNHHHHRYHPNRILAQPIRQLHLNPNTQTQAQTIQISQPKVLVLVTFDPGFSNARGKNVLKPSKPPSRKLHGRAQLHSTQNVTNPDTESIHIQPRRHHSQKHSTQLDRGMPHLDIAEGCLFRLQP